LKAAIDARYAEGKISGIGRYTLNLLKGLAAAGVGFPIRVLIPPHLDLPADVANCPSFDLVCVKTSPRTLTDQFTLPILLRRLDVELLHSLDAFAPLGASCLRVITIYDLIPIAARRLLWSSVKARWWRLWRGWLKQQCRAAARIITLSAHSASDIERLLNVPPDRIRTVPCAVELPGLTRLQEPGEIPGAAPAEPLILYVGRRDPYKNLVALVRAFARVHAARPEVRLLIAGAPDRRYMEPEEEVRRLGLGDSVVFMGHVADGEIAELYRKARVFVFPSRYEGFGLPPLEAMACGTPVVASNCTSIPEAVGDAALLVNPTDPSEMAQAVLRLLSDNELAATMRRRGFERAASFSLKRQAEQTLAVYEELIPGR
jgi:glycosyltransferase involved in cell wall biosynthesis